MAGKFLLLDEAAQRLGISVEEFQRLVERKKFFPLRDGTTLKFKLDDVDRYAAEVAADGEQSGLTIELDMDAPAGAELALADSVAMPAAGEPGLAASDSLAIDLAGSGPLAAAAGPGSGAPPTPLPGNDDLAATMLGTGEAIGLDAIDLDLDAVVGLSSPSVAARSPRSDAAQQRKSAVAEDSGTLAIDLSDISIGAPGKGSGDLVVGSGADAAGSGTNAGSALSGVLDSGISLEDGDAAASGIDLGPLDGTDIDNDGGTMLGGGEAFELGTAGDDDESASVVMAEESSLGESSFFDTGGDGESSTDESALGDASFDLAAEDAGAAIPAFDEGGWGGGAVAADMMFSRWQICSLVCLALVLLTGGFLMLDLVQMVGTRDELGISGLLVAPLARLFGWRQ
jgi:excisionase family DNA binding protein